MPLAARHLASISDEKLQELRDRVDLVAVVQRRVPLKKSGHDWKGLCPFHGEKTSSFYVVPDKKMFHCFGCGVSGDAIKFVMQMEGRSFRGRLTMPIRESGRIVVFGGRLLEGQSEAKYLNSPDTALYQKGHTLFALDRAREAIRREGVALFVEGYFDAIGLHQAGVLTALATCGTALTDKHLELVTKAGAKELVFVFDGDAAGMRAAQRASEIAAAQGAPARVLVPPGGEDPAETVVRVGVQGFREMLASAQPSLEFLLDRALGQLPEGAPVEARVRAVDAVKGIVQAAPSPLARDLYVEKVAEKIGTGVDAIARALAGKASVLAPKTAASREAELGKPLPHSVLKAELVILAALVRNPGLAPDLAHSGAVGEFVHPSLRDAADAVCSGADPQSALRAVEPDSLRQRLLDAVGETDQAGDHTDATH